MLGGELQDVGLEERDVHLLCVCVRSREGERACVRMSVGRRAVILPSCPYTHTHTHLVVKLDDVAMPSPREGHGLDHRHHAGGR